MADRNTPDRHQRVCHMLGHALVLGPHPSGWHALSVVLEARLTTSERVLLLVAAVGALPLETALDVVGAVQEIARPRIPLPPLLDVVSEAAWWAGHASIDERKAVLAAAYSSLPPRDRREFLATASRRAA